MMPLVLDAGLQRRKGVANSYFALRGVVASKCNVDAKRFVSRKKGKISNE
jgi:hypothetical protein